MTRRGRIESGQGQEPVQGAGQRRFGVVEVVDQAMGSLLGHSASATAGGVITLVPRYAPVSGSSNFTVHLLTCDTSTCPPSG